MISYGKQSISNKDIKAVIDVLESDFLTQGPKVGIFESNLTSYTGSKYAAVVNSATSGLHLACLALEVGKGDIVWTSALSFVASSNCALYCGAEVDFVDIDAETWNISIQNLEAKLKTAKKSKKLPKAIIAVHLQGLSVEMNKLHKLSKEYGFKIIEDASHALGGVYKKNKIGSCKYSDIAVFSFHPVKNITTGEGGAITTNSLKIYKKVKILRSHGITREIPKTRKKGDWYYEQIELGYNYRMSDISAVLGISQLKRIEKFIKKRRSISKRYDTKLKHLPLKLPFKDEKNLSGLHLYVIRVEERKKRNQLYNFLKKNGVISNLHYIPIPEQPFYKRLGFKLSDYPEANSFYEDALTLPMYPDLSLKEHSLIINLINEFFSQ